jgi:hypothetical protein
MRSRTSLPAIRVPPPTGLLPPAGCLGFTSGPLLSSHASSSSPPLPLLEELLPTPLLLAGVLLTPSFVSRCRASISAAAEGVRGTSSNRQAQNHEWPRKEEWMSTQLSVFRLYLHPLLL